MNNLNKHNIIVKSNLLFCLERLSSNPSITHERNNLLMLLTSKRLKDTGFKKIETRCINFIIKNGK